jgi:glycosyltransferase involved in cell wall biosynthesis
MKILFVAEYYPPVVMGGAEISLSLLAKELSRKHDVHVLTPNYDSKEDTIKKEGKVTIHKYKSMRKRFFDRKNVSSSVRSKSKIFFNVGLKVLIWAFNREMKRQIENFPNIESFDIVHANNYESAISLDKANIDNKKIVHLRDTRLLKKRLKSVHNFIAISDFLKNEYSKKGRKIITIYNPIEPVKRKISKTDNVLFVGFLTEDKGAHLLPEIARHINKKLIVIGDGYLRSTLNIQAEKIKNMEMKGYVKNIEKYYTNSTITIVPSQWDEGFGRVVAEGQANGCVVIATDKGALPELITNGKTGFLIDSENTVVEMCKIINSLTEKDRKTISKNAIKQSEKYRPNKISKEIENTYTSFVKSDFKEL